MAYGHLPLLDDASLQVEPRERVCVIGRNVTGVQGDAADLDDLDRLYDTVKREKGSLDVLWASAGGGSAPASEYSSTFSRNTMSVGMERMSKVAPCPGSEVTQMKPPLCLTMP